MLVSKIRGIEIVIQAINRVLIQAVNRCFITISKLILSFRRVPKIENILITPLPAQDKAGPSYSNGDTIKVSTW